MDAFISYNSQDAEIVHDIATKLEQAGVSCWLDVWSLIPGRPWQDDAETALNDAQVVIVAIGAAGIGHWHHEELRVALELRSRQPEGRRVIPVLLPGMTLESGRDLPPFLRRLSWVDLSAGIDDRGIATVVSGVRGLPLRPNRSNDIRRTITDDLADIKGDDIVPVREIRFMLGACSRWASAIQNDDGGFPSDNIGTYSCTWASAGLLWSLLFAGTASPDSKWVRRSATWLLDNRNSDGGVPIVNQGDPSIVDATAQAVLACVPVAAATHSARIALGVRELAEWLIDHQQASGGWSYFPNRERPWTSSTVFALLALSTARDMRVHVGINLDQAIETGRVWLEQTKNPDAGWGSQAGDDSTAATSGLAAYCLTILDELTGVADTLDFLYSCQLQNGVWEDTFERPMGRTVIRFGTPYVLLCLANGTKQPWTVHTMLAYRNLIGHFDRDHFKYAESSMHTWPTRDCVLALAALMKHVL